MTTTAGTGVEYPNREHAREVQQQTSRAIDALDALIADAEMLKRKLTGGGLIFGSDFRQLAERAVHIAERAAVLDGLRMSQEWWLADKAESEAGR